MDVVVSTSGKIIVLTEEVVVTACSVDGTSAMAELQNDEGEVYISSASIVEAVLDEDLSSAVSVVSITDDAISSVEAVPDSIEGNIIS